MTSESLSQELRNQACDPETMCKGDCEFLENCAIEWRAADRIDALEAALRPFVDAQGFWGEGLSDDHPAGWMDYPDDEHALPLTVGDMRRAARALSPTTPESDKPSLAPQPTDDKPSIVTPESTS